MGGRAIRIFLVDGSPTGLRTAELGLSTCKAVMAPRLALESLARRPEAKRTGVYVLVGQDDKHPGRRRIYVGEGDEVLARIRKHDGERDFWGHVVIFVSKDENLTKAHVRYLEARLIGIATDARRATLDNGTKPEAGRLPEADQAEMEEFLEHVRMLASTLGLDVFEPAAAVVPTPADAAAGELPSQLHFAGKGFDARAVVRDGQVVVVKDSCARREEGGSISPTTKALRAELLDSGVLREDDRGLVFTQDYAFDSPSSAAAAICGTSVNGRAAWKLADGRPLKDLEESPGTE